MHPSWWEHLSYTQPILDFIKRELSKDAYCPVDGNIFRAFSLELSKVKLAVVGQDCYPNQADAVGVSFAVQKDRLYKDYPFSLKVLSDAITDEADLYFDPSLEMWVRQGALMLNAALSCKVKEPRSHEKLWEPFMMEVFKLLNKQDSLIFLFFGKVAEEYSRYLDAEKHQIVTCPHPAALAYGNRIDKDVFKQTFQRVGTLYREKYNEEFTWVLPF